MRHLLITKGANCALTDKKADTPMHVAASLGRANVIEKQRRNLMSEQRWHLCYDVPLRPLLLFGTMLLNRDGRAPLHQACHVLQ